MLEEYGRAGHFERQLPEARALYAGHWRATERALRRHLPEARSWTEPSGGFLTWVTLGEDVDTVALRPYAAEAGVAYVPGAPFHPTGGARSALRLSYSHLPEGDYDEALRRLASAVRASTA